MRASLTPPSVTAAPARHTQGPSASAGIADGRVGRLLVALQLCHAGLLREPLLYLSLYFKRRRTMYYDLLTHVRRTGDWEAWLAFFLDGVRETAAGAASSAQRIARMFRNDRARLEKSGRRVGSLIRVHEALKERPILSLSEACKRTPLSFPTASTAMDQLVQQGLAREITGKRRGRLFVYEKYLSILNEGAEPGVDA